MLRTASRSPPPLRPPRLQPRPPSSDGFIVSSAPGCVAGRLQTLHKNPARGGGEGGGGCGWWRGGGGREGAAGAGGRRGVGRGRGAAFFFFFCITRLGRVASGLPAPLGPSLGPRAPGCRIATGRAPARPPGLPPPPNGLGRPGPAPQGRPPRTYDPLPAAADPAAKKKVSERQAEEKGEQGGPGRRGAAGGAGRAGRRSAGSPGHVQAEAGEAALGER